MSIFSKYINNCSKLDWQILMNGSIALYNDIDKINKDLEWFKHSKYKIILVDFSKIKSEMDFHLIIKRELNLPEYYGNNLSALNDCLLHDLDIPDHSGIVFVFSDVDNFLRENSEFVFEILGLMDLNSRRHLLTGERFITLLISSDPNLAITQFGSHRIYLR